MANIEKTNSPFPNFSNIFDDFFGGDFFNWPKNIPLATKNTPAANVRETEKAYEIEVAIPGTKKENVKIELHNNVLSISGESRKSESEQNEGEFIRKEYNYSSFRRNFTLPESLVESDKVEANIEDGILKVIVPKKEEVVSKKGRTITIS